jgi:hypothetical protein
LLYRVPLRRLEALRVGLGLVADHAGSVLGPLPRVLPGHRVCRFGPRLVLDVALALDADGPRLSLPIVPGEEETPLPGGTWIRQLGALSATRAVRLAARGVAGACVRLEHPEPEENDRRAGRRKAWDDAAAAIGLWSQAGVPAALVAPAGGAEVNAALHDLAAGLGAVRLVLLPGPGVDPAASAAFARRRNREPAFVDYPGVSWLGPEPVHLWAALGGVVDGLAARLAAPAGPEPEPECEPELLLPPPPRPRPAAPSGAVVGGIVDALRRGRDR